MPIAQEVYDSLMGLVLPEYRLNWVENLVEPGMECYEAYEEMLEAYQRLLTRLNAVDEDPDVEIIINSLLHYGTYSALKMFEYGVKYQKDPSLQTER